MKYIETFKQMNDFIQKNCTADDYELRFYHQDKHFTRFAQNAITQHSSGVKLTVSLQVAFGNKTGRCVTNQTDEESLQQMLQTAESIAKLNQPDPEFVKSVESHELPPLKPLAEATTKLSVEEMVANIEKCVQKAEQENANVSGISEREIGENFLATKNGFIGWDNEADFSHSMTLKKESIETKVSKSGQDYSLFSIEKELEQLFSQFHSLKNPEYLASGKYNVILRPPAFAELMQYLFWTMNRRDADEGSTPFTGQIGKRFFGEKFSVSSTLKNPLLAAPRFNHWGLPTKEIEWIKNGILNALTCDRSYAEKVGCEAEYPFNVSIKGEKSSEQEMMNMVKNGLIINRLWYIRPIDRKNGEMTGLTRDGVLYFEDGKIQKSVTNFRWNEVLHDVSRRILALGKSECIESYISAPAALIKDFNFVDTTTF